jgi:uncharacterized protein YndB with AHSA1/START domain
MLKTLAVIAGVIVILVAAVLIYAATKPDTFRVARSAIINAPPEKIFALINDLRGWRAWSPYENRDPDMKRTFDGPASGKGAAYAWDGNRNVGAGRMEITDAVPPSRIVIKLDFARPFEAHNTAEFTMAPQGVVTNAPAANVATKVTWAMHGPNLFIGKVMGIFINMDTMIGRDFEAGLANLKTLAEK